MPRVRKYFTSRTTANGIKIWQGQFWDLMNKGDKKPPRVDLCPDEELINIHGSRATRKRSEKEKANYLTQLYNEKLELLTEEKKARELEQAKRGSSPMIREVMQKWLDHVAIFRSKTTAKLYLNSVNHYIEGIGDHPIGEFEYDFNTKLLIHLKKQVTPQGNFFSVSNQIRHLKAIQIFFNWAYRKDYIQRPIRLDKPQAEIKDPAVFTMDDVQKLEDYILKRMENEPNKRHRRNLKNHHRFLKMAMATVLRRGAIWSLKLDHIDLKKRIIQIRNNSELDWKNKKNKQVDKPINEDLLEYLEVDLSMRDPVERYYLDDGTGQPCYKDPVALSKSFGRHCRELGLSEIKPLHGIRATMITELINQGVDLAIVKDLVDHESIVTTESYVNSKRITSKNVVESLPRLKRQ